MSRTGLPMDCLATMPQQLKKKRGFQLKNFALKRFGSVYLIPCGLILEDAR